jgi:hypothetical protein
MYSLRKMEKVRDAGKTINPSSAASVFRISSFTILAEVPAVFIGSLWGYTAVVVTVILRLGNSKPCVISELT